MAVCVDLGNTFKRYCQMFLTSIKEVARHSFVSLIPYMPGRLFAALTGVALDLGLLHSYQPFYGSDRSIFLQRHSHPLRPGFDRLQAVSEVVKSDRGTCLDIGCNVGFFSLAMADRGFQTLGIDQNLKNVRLAGAMAKFLKIPNVRFMQARLTPETIGSGSRCV